MQEGANTLHDSSIISLTKSILLGAVGNGDPMTNTLLRKVFLESLTGKLPASVSVENLKMIPGVTKDLVINFLKAAESIRFGCDTKNIPVARIIILE